MFCIEVEIKPSKIHGYGVFAKHDIPKGTIVWKRMDGFDILRNVNNYHTLNNVQTKIVNHFFACYNDKFDVFCDYSIFLNHSDDPNLEHGDEDRVMALKTIKAGEELFGNYDDLG